MTINVPNIDALKAGVQHAQDHLDQWNQAYFFADHTGPSYNTTACLAGHVLLAAGNTWEDVEAFDHTAYTSIAVEACKVLGIEDRADRREWGEQVWGYTDVELEEERDGILWSAEFTLKYNQWSLDLLKERLTELTGVRL